MCALDAWVYTLYDLYFLLDIMHRTSQRRCIHMIYPYSPSFVPHRPVYTVLDQAISTRGCNLSATSIRPLQMSFDRLQGTNTCLSPAWLISAARGKVRASPGIDANTRQGLKRRKTFNHAVYEYSVDSFRLNHCDRQLISGSSTQLRCGRVLYTSYGLIIAPAFFFSTFFPHLQRSCHAIHWFCYIRLKVIMNSLA